MPVPQIVSHGSGGKRTKYLIQFGGVRTPAQFLAKAAEIQSNYFGGGVMRAQYIDPTLGLSNLDQQVS